MRPALGPGLNAFPLHRLRPKGRITVTALSRPFGRQGPSLISRPPLTLAPSAAIKQTAVAGAAALAAATQVARLRRRVAVWPARPAVILTAALRRPFINAQDARPQ